MQHEKMHTSNDTYSGTGDFPQSKNKLQILYPRITQTLHYPVHLLTAVNISHISPMRFSAIVTAGNNLFHLLSDSVCH